ncbi:cyclic-di-AMP-binding protein CbpB [Listeria sp. PSOL-1]|uniref:cyclic-di-AMP-binding protein CbpB n=1 Tax=Listeria sp. PSOL-1 TaxID=1844999 RepID=UPI0013D21FD5|nr:cyclic-di-AMP-binding protein CbpB [Listeria sp. PSOL-1]
MISNRLGSFLNEKLQDGMISAEKVAHVQMGNNLEHALLVLTKCGYSTIPVLDFEFKLYGLISAALITDAIIGLERIEYERLEILKVEDAMETNFPVVKEDFDIENVVRLLVDHPFVCVTSEDFKFQGILTRKIVLKQVNHFIHVPAEEKT